MINFAQFKTRKFKIFYIVLCAFFLIYVVNFIFYNYHFLPQNSFNPVECKTCADLCNSEIANSDFCKDFSKLANMEGAEFTHEGNYLYRSHRVNDGSKIKYDAKTGKKLETCGFWIGFAMQHTTKKSCATDKELEEAKKHL